MEVIQLEHCQSKNMIAGALIKALVRSQFVKQRQLLIVREIME